MTRRLTESLRESPAAIPGLAAIVLFVVWSTSQAGYPLTHWAPGALVVIVLLALALFVVPLALPSVPFAVKASVACLAAYTGLSFLSIAWAGEPGVAWEGANRTLLYLAVFALFALWPARGRGAALLVGAWALAVIGVAVYVLVRLDVRTGAGLGAMFSDERLSYPAGYPNATAAQWLMAFWPALLLSRARGMPWALRGLLAGGCVLLADLALLSQSRGSLYAMPVIVLLVLVFVPGRLRTFAALVPVAAAVGATASPVLAVGDRLAAGHSPASALHTAVAVVALAALLVAALVAVASFLESRPDRPVPAVLERRIRRAVALAASATLVVALAVGLAVAGNPVKRIRHSWESFESGYSSSTSGSRLTSGLGSNRYDFYRVALDELVSHPLAGIGADNFQQQYLRAGRSDETPRYPHSVELRTLSQTGSLGGLLAVLGLAAALTACWRAMRGPDALARAVAAAALGGFAYWAVHGSFDWFWEFAGLGAPAFALLGIACSLQPRAVSAPPGTAPGGHGDVTRHLPRGVVPIALVAVVVAAAILSLAAPWLSEREIQGAARIWPKAPLIAYSRLDQAAKLDPLSDRAYLVAGTIALRFGDLARAEREFSSALGRVPKGAYATLELGAIASASGRRARAVLLLRRAVRLSPRDPLAREALSVALSGRRVSLDALNRAILERATRLA